MQRRRPTPKRNARTKRPRNTGSYEVEQIVALADLGHQYVLAGCTDEATIVFEALNAIAPRDPRWLRAAGESALSAGDPNAAVRYANGLVALTPDESAGYLLRARALLSMGREQQAQPDLVRAHRMGESLATEILRLSER